MSSFRLLPSSSLGPYVKQTTAPHAAGVTIAERTDISLASVVARKGAAAQLSDRVRAEFGVELPRTPRSTGPGDVEFIWAGPNQWLALGGTSEGHAFEQRLRAALAGTASVADQSDGRTILRIGGARSRDVLAKGVLFDLHPAAFGPRDVAITSIAYINVHLWQLDDVPTYELAMFRSFAVAFWEWLSDAAASTA